MAMTKLMLFLTLLAATPKPGGDMLDEAFLGRVESGMVAKFGEANRERIHRGLRQVAARWRESDGSREDLERFAMDQFVADPQALADTMAHMEYALEMLYGHGNEATREVSRFLMLDEGPLRPVDRLLGNLSPMAHIQDDLFQAKVAFSVLLNFPVTTLHERVTQGKEWPRERWVQARLVAPFEHRVPASTKQTFDQASAEAQAYIDGYDIHMDRLELPEGAHRFPEGKTLISHWGLRDEIRALYDQPGGLQSQRIIAKVMDRIVRQEIPAKVIGSGDLVWDPITNRVQGPDGAWVEAAREQDTRYATLLKVFHAAREADQYYPDLPDYVRRSFELQREMPEARVRELLESVLRSPVAKRVGELISKRLGRPLEPFDLWYTGFRVESELDEPALDRIAKARYPSVKAFERDIPNILMKLGFSEDTARFLGERIVVDPARGAGHAYPAMLRSGKSHLRTRVPKDGFDYKGFNIAMHELGHNVEQVFSISRIDHTILGEVPNNAFTEAFAFLFQARDLEILGQAKPDPMAQDLKTLARFWDTFEISGVAILDMDLWHWMYEHPDATPAELREATVELARRVWNEYYAPVFGVKDQILPAIYSHIVCYGLYTPNYPLGFIITYQIERYMDGKDMAREMERMCALGKLAPDVWMEKAVGSPVSTEPLIQGAARALERVGK